MNTLPVFCPAVWLAVGAPIQMRVHLIVPVGASLTVAAPAVRKPPGKVKLVTAEPLYRTTFAIAGPFG